MSSHLDPEFNEPCNFGHSMRPSLASTDSPKKMKDEIVRSLQRLRIRKVRAVPLLRPYSSHAIRTAQQRGPVRGRSSLALPGAVCHHFGFR